MQFGVGGFLLLLVSTTAAAKFVPENLPEISNFDLLDFPELNQEIPTKLGRILSLAFINYLTRVEIPENSDTETNGEPLRPVFPEFEDDVMNLADVHFEITEASNLSKWVTADIHLCNSSISGLMNITNDLRFNLSSLPRAKLNFVLNTGALHIKGLQDLDFNIHVRQGLIHDFMSSEDYFFEISGITLDITAEIENIWTKLNVTKFKIEEASFDQIRMNFQNAVYNDGVLNDRTWAAFSVAVSKMLNSIISHQLVPILNLILPPIVHDLMDECHLSNIIVGNFSCVGANSTSSLNGLILIELSPFITANSNSTVCPVPGNGGGDLPVTTPVPEFPSTEFPIPTDFPNTTEFPVTVAIPGIPGGINTVIVLNDVNFTNVSFNVVG